MKAFNLFKTCLDTFSFLLHHGMSIKTIYFVSKSWNNWVSLDHAPYFHFNFLDTRFLLAKDSITTEVYHTANKFPVHWKLQITRRYKKTAINGKPLSFMEI